MLTLEPVKILPLLQRHDVQLLPADEKVFHEAPLHQWAVMWS